MPIKFVKGMGKSKRALQFGDLQVGDIFMCSEGIWYIKIYNSFDSCGDFEGNALRLDDGQIVDFDDTETVKKLKKDLIIEYSNDDITEWYEED